MIFDRSNSTHRITSITIYFVTFRDSGVYYCLTIQRTVNIRRQAEIRVTVLQCEWEVGWGWWKGGGSVE